jgi:hypothetical protein
MGFADEVDEPISALTAWFNPEPPPKFVKFWSLTSRLWPYSAVPSWSPPKVRAAPMRGYDAAMREDIVNSAFNCVLNVEPM